MVNTNMLKTILQYLKDLINTANGRNALEDYINANEPQSAYDVERLERQYDKMMRRSFFHE